MKGIRDFAVNKTPSIKRNYIYKLIYEILTMVTPFVTAPYVSRVLGADGVGTYSYTHSYMTYFTMFATLGTSSYGMREIARCRDNKEEYSKKFWEIEIISVFTTLICLGVWQIVIAISSEYTNCFIALTPTLIATMFDISWFYTGHEKIGYTVFWNSVCKISGVICIFLFVKSKNDLVLYILLNSLILMLGNLSMWIYLPGMLVRTDIKTFKFKKHFKETLVYFIPTIATSVYTVLDKTLIGIITHNEYQNGYYEQATKIINMAKTFVFSSVNSVMGARISYLFVDNKIGEIKQRINKSINFILLLGYGALFGVVSVAKDFVPIFFGEEYGPVISLLYWMSPLIVIIGISNCLGSQYYTPAGLRWKSARYILIGSGINLIINIILIPVIESTGAVIGSITAELAISLLYVMNCDSYITLCTIMKYSYKRIVAGLIMMIVINQCVKFDIYKVLLLILEVLVGIAVYFIVLLLLKDDMICEFVKNTKRRLAKNG